MAKELNNLISTLSEENFKKLIKEYIKEKYQTPHVRIIDGPYDGGNDLEIIIGNREVKKNIQITVQKIGYEDKLFKDLEKSAKNVKEFNYLNSLDFYINQNISKEKRNELELRAEIDFGITLKIFDALILAEEGENYTSIKQFAYEAHHIRTHSLVNVADKQTKILYDVLTLDHNSIEIKRNFINSYILSFLYMNPDSSIDEIYNFVNPNLNNKLHKHFLEKELNNLRAKKQLESPKDKKYYRLSKDKYSEISKIYNIATHQEEKLCEMIDTFISKRRISCNCTELVELLYKLYQENYTIDIEEIKNTNNSFSASIKKTFNNLISFFTKKGIEIEVSKKYSKELLKLCGSNDFLNKLSTIYLFNNLYSSNKLEKYINEKHQKIFLDTQILIRMICVLFNDKFDYSDSALQSVKILLSTFDRFRRKLNIISSYDYVNEVYGHLLEAIRLQRFLKLPFISKLGKSKNVFYNAYVELKHADQLDNDIDFLEFIKLLLDEEDIDFSNESNSLKTVERKITDIFELYGINLIYHDTYPNYQSIKRAYEVSLSYQSKERTYTARENDLRTILYLSSKEYHTNKENGEIDEPFLITWDSAFYSFRKELLAEHKELTYWYIYSPLKVVDRFSVMNFNLNPKSISLNIVALTETNFNYSTKKTSFIDVISNFFNTKDVSKLSIINKLADLQRSTKDIDDMPTQDEFKEREEDSIINLLQKLRNHYHSYESNYKFDDIIKIFELPQFENGIIEILKKAINALNLNTDPTTMFSSFDKLIKINNEKHTNN